MSIGSRSQSARTYLEKYLDELEGCSRNDLVKHGLMALRETLPTDQVVSICILFSDPLIKELTEHNVTVCIVGENQKYAEYNNEETKQFLDLLDSTKKPARERAQVNLLELRKRSVSFFIWEWLSQLFFSKTDRYSLDSVRAFEVDRLSLFMLKDVEIHKIILGRWRCPCRRTCRHGGITSSISITFSPSSPLLKTRARLYSKQIQKASIQKA